MGSFHQTGTGWNVNSRMALVFAIVDRGTFAIDAYDSPDQALATMDKAALLATTTATRCSVSA